MANKYVYHAGDNSDGTTWAKAYTTLSAAATASAAGDSIYVADDHAETSASSITVTSPGTEALPCRILCVNRAGTVPPVAADLRTTGAITTTGGSSISFAGSISEIYGLVLSAGTGAVTAQLLFGATTGRTVRAKNCTLKMIASGSANRIILGNVRASVGIAENCTVQFSNTSQSMQTSGRGFWLNTPTTPIVLGLLPGEFFRFNENSSFYIEGVDLSLINNLCRSQDVFSSNLVIKDCKLKAGVTYGAAPIGIGGVQTTILRSDSADTNYRLDLVSYGLTQTVETTVVRTGGASDGTTPIAWKMVVASILPVRSLPISIWNDTTGSSVTVTVQGLLSGGGAVPTNADIWIEVSYLGTSGFPISSLATSGLATALTTAANTTAGSGTWGGAGTKFAMSASFTPVKKGPLTITVCASRASSTTYYIDPKPIIT